MSRVVSDAELLHWLDQDPDRLAKHLERNPSDEARLELATSLSGDQGKAISEVLSPPADLVERLRVRLLPDPQAADAFRLAAGLLTLPLEAARLLLGESSPISAQRPAEEDS